MPNVALNSNGERIEIRKNLYENDMDDVFSYRSMTPFSCPHCQSEMIFRCGAKTRAHFSHKSRQDRPCIANEYYSLESDAHIQAKMLVQAFLVEKTSLKILQEVAVNNRERIADIAVVDSNQNPIVSIEIQLSKINFETIMERTQDYNKNNMGVIWLLGEENHQLIQKENPLYNDLNYAFIKFKLEEVSGDFSIAFIKDETEKDVWRRKDNNFLIAILCLQFSIKSIIKKYKTIRAEDIITLLNLNHDNDLDALKVYLAGRDYVPDRTVTIWDLAFFDYRKQIRTSFLQNLSKKKDDLDKENSQILSKDRYNLQREQDIIRAKMIQEKAEAESRQLYYERMLEELQDKEKNLMEKIVQPKIREIELQKASLVQKEIDLINSFSIKEKNLIDYEREVEESLRKRIVEPELKEIRRQREKLDNIEHNLKIERRKFNITIDEAKDIFISNLEWNNDGVSKLIYERHEKLIEEIKSLKKIKKALEDNIEQWPDFISAYFERQKKKPEDI